MEYPSNKEIDDAWEKEFDTLFVEYRSDYKGHMTNSFSEDVKNFIRSQRLEWEGAAYDAGLERGKVIGRCSPDTIADGTVDSVDGGLCTPMTTIEDIVQQFMHTFKACTAYKIGSPAGLKLAEQLRITLTTLVAEQRADGVREFESQFTGDTTAIQINGLIYLHPKEVERAKKDFENEWADDTLKAIKEAMELGARQALARVAEELPKRRVIDITKPNNWREAECKTLGANIDLGWNAYEAEARTIITNALSRVEGEK